MNCPRCNQPMTARIRRHKDGSRDVTHTCKRHPLWQTMRERRDATDAQVVMMRNERPVLRAALRTAQKIVEKETAKTVGAPGPLPAFDFEHYEWAAFRELADKLDASVSSVAIPPGMLGVIGPRTIQAQAAPKPPRPVKVGDVLLVHGLADRRRVVREVNHGGAHYYPDPGNVDIGQFMSFHDMSDAGWTHADGAAIAEAAQKRERPLGVETVLLSSEPVCGSQRRYVEAFDGTHYTIRFPGKGGTDQYTRNEMQRRGWTFADTGEAV